ncbi:MAG: S8 family peptidase [Bacteroidetes bacterium]|nr:S8 family peptidase [Bacteroidota bacterium]
MIFAVLFLSGFRADNNSITNYYYYKGQPFNLRINTDKIFIKTNEILTDNDIRSKLSSVPDISLLSKYDAGEKMQFATLNRNLGASEINQLVNSLNSISGIEYASAVFSPFEGDGNPKVLQGVTDEILVQFKPYMNDADIKNYLAKNGLMITQTLDLGGGKSFVLKVPRESGLQTMDAANEVYNSGLVNWSEPNFYYSGLLTYAPNDPFFPRQWSVRNTGNNIPEGISGTAGCDMRVDSAWNITLGINKCIVGMVDSGIDTTHEDIKANLLNSLGYDFINGHPLQTDDMNHGTCTGGIVAAVGNNSIGISGIAPNVKLIGIKIFNAAGSTSTAALTNGLIYSWQQGEWISSNSWGGGSPVSAADQAILDGVTNGRNGKGTVFCIATGNSNGALQWPSTNTNVIAVGGNSPCNTRKSTTSCDGETWWGANYGTGLYVVTPCVKIYATDRMGSVGYTPTNYDSTFNGTSSATPNCAGVCALALSLDSTMSWDTLRVRISRTADKIGSYSYTSAGPLTSLGNTWNNEMGYGKVNAYRLLQLVQQQMGPVITHTPLSNTEQTSGTRAVNAVITPATAPIVASWTKLFYRKSPASVFDSVQMTNSSGTNWTANMTLSGAGTYQYYLRTADNTGRFSFAPNGAPASYYSFLASSDTVKPVISYTPLSNVPKVNWPATVTASVTDNIGIDSVWVRWYKNTTSTGWKQFRLNLSSGTNYSAAFNSVQADVNFGDSIFYRIIARDISSNHNADSTALNTFKIINQFNACIGTGTTSSNYPFTTYWMAGRTQMLFTASELNAAGVTSGNSIMKLGFNVISNSTQLMNGFNIRYQLTTQSSLTGWVTSGWTTGYSGTYSVPGTGWQYIDMTAPYFTYNGTSNLLIEVCYTNTSYTSYTTVNSTAAAGMTYGYYNDNITGCTTTSGAVQANRPNVCFVLTATGTGNNTVVTPSKYELSQNYPNPFNPVTKINFAIPKQGFVTMKIYDVLGREVRTLVDEVKQAGNYSVDFNAAEFASGVYFYKLQSGDFSEIKRMILVK